MIIYKITNKITGLIYIGQTKKSINIRFKEHCKKSNCCRRLKHSIQKYGKENFDVKIIYICSSLEEMNEKEVFFIKKFNSLHPNGYNLDSGGKNKIPSAESRKIQSEKMKGRRVSIHTEIKPGQRISPATEWKKGRLATNKKAIIDLSTGIIFDSVADAAIAFNICTATMFYKVKYAKNQSRFAFVGNY